MTAFKPDPDELREIYMSRVSGGLRRIKWVPVVIVVLILFYASIAYVPPGHVGVLTLFGRVTGEALPEGTHIVNPFKFNHRMSVRTQELKETASVPSNEGLIVTLDTSLLFHLNSEKAPEVYRSIGPNYIGVVLEPTLRAAIRSVTSAHQANALYTGEREKVAQQIGDELRRELAKRGIVVENILLRDVQLPRMLATAIEAKQQAEQEALRMNFILDKEKREAERKRIEAAGIRDFQQIVAQGISPQLLTWKGIEATEKLAQSSNSKVVVIGSGRNGLPLILGGTD
ncbi:MAG: prohibitin family protein [Acidobacteria bacterium]|nr:prohibitin family protein [Acidobacteriota bacterium]